jgi:hypothetical protein
MMKKLLTEWKNYISENNREQVYRDNIESNLQAYMQWVLQRIVGNKLYISDKNFVVVNTSKGNIPFYQSSGASTADKNRNDWHIFLGVKPYKNVEKVGATLFKTQETIDMANGGDKELTLISICLGEAWNQGILQNLSPESLDGYVGAYLDNINTQISQRKEYQTYSPAAYKACVINYLLFKAKAIGAGTFASQIDPENDYIGLNDIPANKIDPSLPADKKFPAIYKTSLYAAQ